MSHTRRKNTMQRLLALTLLTRLATAGWDTLIAPATKKAYLRLSTDDLIEIDYSEDYTSGNTIPPSSVISLPTTGNYSIALANNKLYAFYSDSEDDPMTIVELDEDNEWSQFDFNTTLTSNSTKFYDDATLMTSYDDDSDSQVIYIYGGRQDTAITNRLLEFNPTAGTLQSVMTSVSPTSFYGASSTILDSQGIANIVVGGKASSGWVSMFQIAIWEYTSWTFKTVQQASFNVNSRVSPLILPVLGDSGDTESVIVVGGILGNSWASPYLLSLNVTGDWEWKNVTGSGDFNPKSCLGAVVADGTLITIASSSSSKRDGSAFEVKLYDAGSFDAIDSFQGVTSSSSELSSFSSDLSSSSFSSSSSSDLSSSKESSSSISSSQSSSISHTPSLAAASSSTEAVSATTSQLSSAFITKHTSHTSHTSTIVIAAVVPVVSIVVLCLLGWLLWKKYKSSSSDDYSDSGTEYSDDYFKAINTYDQASITSWNAKRDEFRRSIVHTPHGNGPTRTSTDLSFEGRTPVTTPTSPPQQSGIHLFKTVYKPHTPRTSRPSGPFANPEDYADKQELSPMSHSNKSRASVLSSTPTSSEYDEEQKIDEFLGNRDVQVLVSSKRRSKLRITNPDLDLESVMEVQSVDTGSTVYTDEKANELPLENWGEDAEYFKEVLLAFDHDDDGESSNSGTSRSL